MELRNDAQVRHEEPQRNLFQVSAVCLKVRHLMEEEVRDARVLENEHKGMYKNTH